MNCIKCGAEREQDAKFCMKCGEPFPEEVTHPEANDMSQPVQQAQDQPSQLQEQVQKGLETVTSSINTAATQVGSAFSKAGEKVGDMTDKLVKNGGVKQLPWKKVSLIAIPVVAVIAVLMILMPMLKGSAYTQYKHTMVQKNVDGELHLSFDNNKPIKFEESVVREGTSLYRDRAFVITDDSEDQVLYYVSAKDKDKVKVKEGIKDARFSDNGAKLFYTVMNEEDSNVLELYVYDVSSKKHDKITSEMTHPFGSPYLDQLAVSPDGKTVAYCEKVDDEDFFYTVKTGNKVVEELKNSVVFAVADNAKYIYYGKAKDGETALYVKGGKKDEQKLSNSPKSYSFNLDYSEIVFSDSNGTYLSKQGKEKQKLFGKNSHSWVLPVRTVIDYQNDREGKVVGVKTFLNQFIHYENEVYKINSKGDGTDKITSKGRYALLTQDASYLYCLNGDKLEVFYPQKPNKEKTKLAEDVDFYQVAEDGKNIYYVNKDKEIMYLKGIGAKPKKIADDVDFQYSYPMFTIAANGNLFFIADEELYISKKGAAKQKISGISEPTFIYRSGLNVIVDTEENTYQSNGNEKFTKLF